MIEETNVMRLTGGSQAIFHREGFDIYDFEKNGKVFKFRSNLYMTLGCRGEEFEDLLNKSFGQRRMGNLIHQHALASTMYTVEFDIVFQVYNKGFAVYVTAIKCEDGSRAIETEEGNNLVFNTETKLYNTMPFLIAANFDLMIDTFVREKVEDFRELIKTVKERYNETK